MSLEERVEQIVLEQARDAAAMNGQDAYGLEQANTHHLNLNYYPGGAGGGGVSPQQYY